MTDFSFTREFHLDCFLLDYQGKASLVTYFNLMQEVALKHANQLGFGFNDMVKNNMIWVLTRMGIKINKSMKWDQVITVKTWSRGIDGAYSFREFEFYDQNKELIGVATSSWVPIDIQSRRPVKIFDPETVNKIANKQAVDLEVKKITLPENLEIGLHHKVRLTDLDINNHANNARYVEWIYNSIPQGMMDIKNGFEFHINYLGEAKLHDQVEIHRLPIIDKMNEFYFSGLNQSTKRSFFSAHLKLTI